MVKSTAMYMEFTTAALVTMLVTLDPPGLAPIFLSLTRGMSAGERRQVAVRASIIVTPASSVNRALHPEMTIGWSSTTSSFTRCPLRLTSGIQTCSSGTYSNINADYAENSSRR